MRLTPRHQGPNADDAKTGEPCCTVLMEDETPLREYESRVSVVDDPRGDLLDRVHAMIEELDSNSTDPLTCEALGLLCDIRLAILVSASEKTMASNYYEFPAHARHQGSPRPS